MGKCFYSSFVTIKKLINVLHELHEFLKAFSYCLLPKLDKRKNLLDAPLPFSTFVDASVWVRFLYFLSDTRESSDRTNGASLAALKMWEKVWVFLSGMRCKSVLNVQVSCKILNINEHRILTHVKLITFHEDLHQMFIQLFNVSIQFVHDNPQLGYREFS